MIRTNNLNAQTAQGVTVMGKITKSLWNDVTKHATYMFVENAPEDCEVDRVVLTDGVFLAYIALRDLPNMTTAFDQRQLTDGNWVTLDPKHRPPHKPILERYGLDVHRQSGPVSSATKALRDVKIPHLAGVLKNNEYTVTHEDEHYGTMRVLETVEGTVRVLVQDKFLRLMQRIAGEDCQMFTTIPYEDQPEHHAPIMFLDAYGTLVGVLMPRMHENDKHLARRTKRGA